MAQWRSRIELQPEWDATKNGSMIVNQLATVIAKKIKETKPLNQIYLESRRLWLMEQFEEIGERSNLDVEEFDDLMEELYNWGDTDLDGKWNGEKVCWITSHAI